MRKIIFLFFILISQNVLFAFDDYTTDFFLQNNQASIIEKRVLPNGDFLYEFTSNKLLIEERINIWERRFLIIYPEIISIELNHNNQRISLILPSDHKSEFLKSILNRFNVTNFFGIY